MPAALSYRNLIATRLSNPSLSHNMTSASVDAAFPSTNQYDPDPSLVTRVNYVNSTGGDCVSFHRVQVSAANDAGIRVIAALNVRLAPHVTRVLLQTTNLAQSANPGSVTIDASSFVPRPGTTDRFDLFAVLSAAGGAAAYGELVVIVPPGNSGYYEVGHLWCGPALVWDEGIDGNWKQLLLDDSVVERFPGGSWSAYGHPTHHGIELSRSLLTYDQAIGSSAAPTSASLRSVLREVGTSKPVIMIPRTASQHEMQTLSVYGLIQGPLPSIDHQGGNRYATGLRIW